MSRHLRLMALCAVLLAGAGCSEERRPPTGPTPVGPTGPTAPAPPVSPSAAQRSAALTLVDAASVHAAVMTSALTSATWDGKVLFDAPCAFGSGSFQGVLDGGESPVSGTLLPTGSHKYVASFNNCLVAWWGVTLDGVASAAYTAADWSNVTATVSADSVRGWGLASLGSDLHDVTVGGAAVWTSFGFIPSATTYTPSAGSHLINNRTNIVATFGGGAYSVLWPQGSFKRDRFDNLKIAISGTEYTLDGSLDLTRPTNGALIYTGEVRITSNGTLVARIYGDALGALSVEVLVPLVSL